MHFNEYLKVTAVSIDRQVEVLLSDWSRELRRTTKELEELNRMFVEANFGGKRIRGALILLSYKLFGGEDERQVLKIAAAYEIFHTAILIHDDIADHGKLRRGRKTIHQLLGNNHYAISQAIFLGDLGFFLSFRILAESPVAKLFTEIVLQTTIGQLLDIKQSEPEKVAVLKTAKYTITGPFKIGAILASRGKKTLDALQEFGDELGIIYQIKDDILDGDNLTSSKEELNDHAKKAGILLGRIKVSSQGRNLLKELIEYLMERKS